MSVTREGHGLQGRMTCKGRGRAIPWQSKGNPLSVERQSRLPPQVIVKRPSVSAESGRIPWHQDLPCDSRPPLPPHPQLQPPRGAPHRRSTDRPRTQATASLPPVDSGEWALAAPHPHSYWNIDGEQIGSVWVPLDPMDAEAGVTWVLGPRQGSEDEGGLRTFVGR